MNSVRVDERTDELAIIASKDVCITNCEKNYITVVNNFKINVPDCSLHIFRFAIYYDKVKFHEVIKHIELNTTNFLFS